MIERNASLCLCFKERFFVLRDLNFDQICGKEQELAKIFQNTSKQNTKKYSKLLSLSLSLCARARASESLPSFPSVFSLPRSREEEEEEEEETEEEK